MDPWFTLVQYRFPVRCLLNASRKKYNIFSGQLNLTSWKEVSTRSHIDNHRQDSKTFMLDSSTFFHELRLNIAMLCSLWKTCNILFCFFFISFGKDSSLFVLSLTYTRFRHVRSKSGSAALSEVYARRVQDPIWKWT